MPDQASQTTIDDVLERIEALYAEKGSEHYGEGVSQIEHALQSALVAETEGASETLIVAALLHDIGHLLHPDAQSAADRGVSDRHEFIGAGWLAEGGFGAGVIEPIRLHVDAKRYLCRVESKYRASLSAASQRSLDAQGGIFDTAAADRFAALPYAGDALRLRRWDEAAKVFGKPTPDWDHYRQTISRVLASGGE